MGELILCKQPIAANPFFIEETSLNVYSLEELSYYIANNTYLLNADFISQDLCNWIGRELGCKDLQKQLLEAMEKHVPLHVFVGILLTGCGYLTQKEIRQVLATITGFENKSPVECQKMRADRLMEKGRLVDAIYEYEYMLDDSPTKKMSREFEGDIWHNLGCAYAKLFFFDEAAMCFEQAYMRNRRAVSMRLMLASLRCNKNEEGFQTLVDKYFIPEDMVADIKEEVSALSHQEAIIDFDRQVDELRKRTDQPTLFEDKATEILTQWKQQYNRLCRI